MTQPVSYQVPAHPSGLDMRTQLNVIVLAMLGDNAGPVEPPEMYPGMMWGDTTANRLKRRTNANDGWINIGPLDDFLGDLRTQIAAESGKCVLKTGDTMSGGLTITGFDQYGSAGQLRLCATNYGVIVRNDGATCYLMSTAAGDPYGTWNSLRPFTWDLGGASVNIGSGFTYVGVQSQMHVYGRTYHRPGPGNGDAGEAQFMHSSGWTMCIRARNGGGLELINNAYNNVPWAIDDAGNLFTNMGGGQYRNDGNVWMPWYGGWLSDMNTNLANLANAKAPNGAQVQWNSGIAESAGAWGGQNVCDTGNPWVMEGVRVTTSTDINRIYPRIIWQRNA
ncbi:hypothetical protein [Paraburkholderia youngii]|uniref:phage tail fiber protein n=1 Tax=Paraburkholderia youngii TaxID=2782701 RepID=UPI003D260569